MMKIPNIHDKQTHFHEQQHCRYVKALGTVGIEKAKKKKPKSNTYRLCFLNAEGKLFNKYFGLHCLLKVLIFIHRRPNP